MTVLSRSCIGIGLLLLTHAGYSALEFSQLSAHSHRTPSAIVPLDIQIETVIAVVLVCLGLVAGAERLKPVGWNVWAGKIEQEGGAANPYLVLEERPGFLDIKAKRAEFAAWARERGSVKDS